MNKKVTIEEKVLSENDRLAADIRSRLHERKITARSHLLQHPRIDGDLGFRRDLFLHPVKGPSQIVQGQPGFQIGILVLEHDVCRPNQVSRANDKYEQGHQQLGWKR